MDSHGVKIISDILTQNHDIMIYHDGHVFAYSSFFGMRTIDCHARSRLGKVLQDRPDDWAMHS